MTETELQTALAKRLKEMRIFFEYTQKGLARQSGLSINTIYKLEHGKTKIHATTYEKLHDALCVDYKDFFEFDKPLDADLLLKHINRYTNKLTSKERFMAHHLLHCMVKLAVLQR